MAKTNLKKIIGNKSHWTINKALAREIGLIETLILQHIIDLQSVFNRDEIFQSYEDMAEELGISVYAIKNSIPKLKSLGFISIERKSVGFRNFYKINEEVVLNYLNGGELTSELNSTHQRVWGIANNSQSVENDTTSELISTLSELDSTCQRVESDTAITNNTTNNTLEKINNKNTTTSSSGNLKNIAEKILDVLIDYDSEIKEYNLAIEDFNELGGIDGISEILEWEPPVKSKWNSRIQNVYSLK